MEYGKMIQRCQKMIEEAGFDAVKQVGDTLFEFAGFLHWYGRSEEATKEDLTKYMGDVYIGLTVLCEYAKINYADMEDHINYQLGSETEMNRDEFIDKCLKVIELSGDEVPFVIRDKANALVYEIIFHGRNEDATRETLKNSIADMYIGLMVIGKYAEIDSKEMDQWIEHQLGVK